MAGYVDVAANCKVVDWLQAPYGSSLCHWPVSVSGYVRIVGGYVDVVGKWELVNSSRASDGSCHHYWLFHLSVCCYTYVHPWCQVIWTLSLMMCKATSNSLYIMLRVSNDTTLDLKAWTLSNFAFPVKMSGHHITLFAASGEFWR